MSESPKTNTSLRGSDATAVICAYTLFVHLLDWPATRCRTRRFPRAMEAITTLASFSGVFVTKVAMYRG